MPPSPSERLRQWLQSGEARLHPAGFPQLELWEASPVPAGDPSNNICTITTLKGPVSREFCEEAMARVVARQEALRLSILPGKTGPLQLVRKSRRPALRFRQVLRDEVDDAAFDQLVEELIRTPFDLVAGPLYRIDVIRRAPEEHVLVLVIHHAIADGWSIGVFMTDLWTAYAFRIFGLTDDLEPVGQPYSEWCAAERAFWSADQIEGRRPFWRETLAGAPRLWDAPPAAPADAGRRGRRVGEFAAERIEAVRALAGRQGTTLFSTLLAAFQIVMAEATGKDDILVGSPVANRNRKAAWETIGSFAGIVPFRGRIVRHSTFEEHLAATQQATVDCLARALPFVELVKCLDEPVVPGRNPVFDVRFALQNHPVPEVSTPGLEIDYRIRSTGTARFDLACELTEIGRSIEAVWLFREDLFPAGKVGRWHHRFDEILGKVCRDPGTRLCDLLDTKP